MKYAFRWISAFLMLILCVSSVPVLSYGADVPEISYKFSTLLPGRADGTVTVTGVKTDGEYGLAWGTQTGLLQDYLPLADATHVTVSGSKLTYSPQPLTRIPVEATHLWVTEHGLPLASVEIPAERRSTAKTVQYSFGVISDVHFGAGSAAANFNEAMTWFDDAGVDFVATVGDNTCGGSVAEWNLFAENYESYDVPLWLTLGNHDALAWNLSVTPDAAMKNLKKAFPYYGTETHPYGDGFTLTLSDRHPDYDYTVAYRDDLYLFMGIGAASNDSEDKNIDQRLSDDQLAWLEEELTAFYASEDHGKAVLFFHYYTLETGMKVSAGTEWDKASSKKLHDLLNKFPGVLYFNGHNHHDFDSGLPLSYGNVYASMHLPSLGYGVGEGYFVEVCDDGVLVTGVDFVSGQIVSRATYDLSDDFSDSVAIYGMSLRTTASGAIQWRAKSGDSGWTKLTTLADLNTDGTVQSIPYSGEKTVDFRANETHVQWKLSRDDDSAWDDLIALEEIPKDDPQSDSPASESSSVPASENGSDGGAMIWITVISTAVILCVGAVAVVLILRRKK